MLRENLKDTAEILANILDQPLEIPGIAEPLSLLQAVQNYGSQVPGESDLLKILHTLSSHPEPTEILICEIDLLAQELS